MTKEEELKQYYEYEVDTANPRWYVKQPPFEDGTFQKGLTQLAGTNTHGDPILRVVWGGTVMSDTANKPQLKYKQMWKGLSHFIFNDGDDAIRVNNINDAPDDALPVPVYEEIELGRLRWIIEKWRSPEDIAKVGGMGQDALAEDGTKLFRAIPGEGIYECWTIIHSHDRKYRGLDAAVLNQVAAMWKYQQETSIKQQYADMIEDAKNAKKAEDEAARKEMHDFDPADLKIFREQQRIEREEQIEEQRQSRSITI